MRKNISGTGSCVGSSQRRRLSSPQAPPARLPMLPRPPLLLSAQLPPPPAAAPLVIGIVAAAPAAASLVVAAAAQPPRPLSSSSPPLSRHLGICRKELKKNDPCRSALLLALRCLNKSRELLRDRRQQSVLMRWYVSRTLNQRYSGVGAGRKKCESLHLRRILGFRAAIHPGQGAVRRRQVPDGRLQHQCKNFTSS